MDSKTEALPQPVLALRSAAAVRARCSRILEGALRGETEHFRVDLDALSAVAARVAAVTRERYPDLDIPLHARKGHFGSARVDALAGDVGAQRWPAAMLDLVLVSVLLDAGAGPRWRFDDALTGETIGRSEGLAVASLRAFQAGLFSSCDDDPYRVDAEALAQVSAEALGAAFGVRDDNPLVGVPGRVALLHGLADALRNEASFPGARPSGIAQALGGAGAQVSAPDVLAHLLHGLADIWPSRHTLRGHNLGDVWPHPLAGGEGETAGWVPLHKLSQWLTYSLVEPLRAAGLDVTQLDGLTGLAEYRNGGMFVDMGVLVPREASVLGTPQEPDGTLVIEWRALTVALLDRLAPLVRAELGKAKGDFPLGCVLEGGTWATGRIVARERRDDGAPPIRIASDGTLF
ncbi:MAG: DUF1688 family protein [Nannocystaceae bacterium]|nr:URC4/urg3 family protein [bacterium]